MNTFLLIVAVVITAVLFIPFLIVQSVRRRDDLGAYHLNVATNIDYVWGSLLFGEDGHTVSATVWKRAIATDRRFYYFCVDAINFLFRDESHCVGAYINEYE